MIHIPPGTDNPLTVATEVHDFSGRLMPSRRLVCRPGLVGMLMAAMLLAAGCARGATQGPTTPISTSTTSASSSSIAALPADCTDTSPCPVAAGTYKLVETGLKDAGVVGGLELTLPEGWSTVENNAGELALAPADRPQDRLLLWLDLNAVKSSGPGHGTTVLYDVGTTPDALITWLTSDPDFHIVAKPTPATVGDDIRVTSTALNVSATARYGDSGCPANPRCADLFTKVGYWSGDSYGISGDEEIHLYLGTIRLNGEAHTFFVVLDAESHADLGRLEDGTRPILDSIQLPG